MGILSLCPRKELNRNYAVLRRSRMPGADRQCPDGQHEPEHDEHDGSDGWPELDEPDGRGTDERTGQHGIHAPEYDGHDGTAPGNGQYGQHGQHGKYGQHGNGQHGQYGKYGKYG